MNNAWTREDVKNHVIEAAKVHIRLRGPRGPKEYGGCWPDSPQSQHAYGSDPAQAPMRFVAPAEITLFDAVCGWKTWVSQEEGDILWMWATKRLRWNDLAYFYNRDKRTLLRWFGAGVDRIALALSKKGARKLVEKKAGRKLLIL